MWIKCKNESTSRIYVRDLMDDPLDLSDQNTAQVPEELGEALCKKYEAIVPKTDSADENEVKETETLAEPEQEVDDNG